jgi:hypothetical protein
MSVLEVGVIIGLYALIIYLEISHRKERKDLYSRIMAKDLNDYSAIKNGPGKAGNFIKENLDKRGGD